MAEQSTGEGGHPLMAAAATKKTVVTVSFVRDDESGKIRTCIYQDSPDFRTYGDCGLFTYEDVLELLKVLGFSGDGKALLQEIPKNKTSRQQFKLEPEQEAQIRKKFFAAKW